MEPVSAADCEICAVWARPQDHENYRDYVRDYVRDETLRFHLRPMSFDQYLGLDEVHSDHRDQATMLRMVLDMKESEMRGERVWLVPQSISAVAAAPGEWVEAELPTFTTRFRRRWHKGTGHTSLELSVNGFGATAGESLVYTEGVRDQVPFSVLKYKVVRFMARALAEKQRSGR